MESNVENNEATLSSPCSLRTSLLGSNSILALSISLTCFLFLWSTTSPYLATFSILLLSTIFYFVLSKRRVLVEAASPIMEASEVSHLEVSEVEATGFRSDSETTEESLGNEIFELGWSCPSNLGGSVAVSESECSDFDGQDDDLIEINLPEGDPDGSKLKLTEFVCRKDASPVEILEDDMEEVSEDDGLMEIDLFMGSIKCSGVS